MINQTHCTGILTLVIAPIYRELSHLSVLSFE